MDLKLAARAAEMLQGRWENDPLRLWSPSPRQQLFLNSPKPEVALLGANRSGKSDALAALIASMARFGNPNPRTAYSSSGQLQITDRAMAIWVIGLTDRLVKEGIQPKIVNTAYTPSETHPAFIPPCEIDGWNINDQTWRLKNGSIIVFKSADSGRDVFQSAGRDLVAFDEICNWEVYKEATFRAPGGQRRLMIRLAATLLPPLGMAGGVSWYYPEKIKPWWAAGNKENQVSNPHPHLDIFSMGIRDNPYIARAEIERLEDMLAPGSFERRIRLDGELLPSIGGSIAYSAFNRALHVDPNVRPETIDPRLPLALCVDFNVSPCVWEIGQRTTGSNGEQVWRIHDEIFVEQFNVGSMVDIFRQRYPTHGAEVHVYGDQTGAIKSAQSGVSNYYIMAEAFKGYPVPVRQLLPTKNPPVVDRLNAVNRQLSNTEGRVGLIVSPICEELIADFEEVLRDPRGGIKKTHHMDSPYWRRTHASDAVGYAIAYTDPVPRSVAVERRIRHVPTPGYLWKGGRASGSLSTYPASYNADSRLRRGTGGILPPRRP